MQKTLMNGPLVQANWGVLRLAHLFEVFRSWGNGWNHLSEIHLFTRCFLLQQKHISPCQVTKSPRICGVFIPIWAHLLRPWLTCSRKGKQQLFVSWWELDVLDAHITRYNIHTAARRWDPSKMQGAPENTMKICQF